MKTAEKTQAVASNNNTIMLILFILIIGLFFLPAIFGGGEDAVMKTGDTLRVRINFKNYHMSYKTKEQGDTILFVNAEDPNMEDVKIGITPGNETSYGIAAGAQLPTEDTYNYYVILRDGKSCTFKLEKKRYY